MICPVCEHQQEFGFECENCGKDLGGFEGLGAPPVTQETVEGFEQTELLTGGDDFPLPVMTDLEVTKLESAGDVSVTAMDDMERTAAEKMNVTVEKMPDMSEDDRAADDGVRTVLQEGVVTCRYCREVQPPAGTCRKCSMALPKLPPPKDVATGAKKDAPTVFTRCKSCGAPTPALANCRDCGRFVPLPTE